MVNAVLSSCHDNGAITHRVVLDELIILPCKACDGCQDSRSCIHEDDMQEILTLMEQSDIWILGTPIYWWGPTAQMKTFIDRWYGVKQSLFQGKKILLVVSMGGGNEYYSRHVIGMFEDICNYLGMDFLDPLIAPRMRTKNSAIEVSSLLDRAKDLGSMILTSTCRCNENVKGSIA